MTSLLTRLLLDHDYDEEDDDCSTSTAASASSHHHHSYAGTAKLGRREHQHQQYHHSDDGSASHHHEQEDPSLTTTNMEDELSPQDLFLDEDHHSQAHVNIAQMMEEAKIVFEKGSHYNRRYQEEQKQQTPKHFLSKTNNRNVDHQRMNFPQSAEAAVNNILEQHHQHHPFLDILGNMASPTNNSNSNNHHHSLLLPVVLSDVSSPRHPISTMFGTNDCPPASQLISHNTVRKLQSLEMKWHAPDAPLATLLQNIQSKEHSKRSNAVGALYLFTTVRDKCIKLCYTRGVLPALVSVLIDAAAYQRTRLEEDDDEEDDENEDDELSFSLTNNPKDKTTTTSRSRMSEDLLQARDRSIACMRNMARYVETRFLLFHTPFCVTALLQHLTMTTTSTSSPRRVVELPNPDVCHILAWWGKSIEHRLLLARIPGLFPLLFRILRKSDEPKELEDDDPKENDDEQPTYVLSLSHSSTSSTSTSSSTSSTSSALADSSTAKPLFLAEDDHHPSESISEASSYESSIFQNDDLLRSHGSSTLEDCVVVDQPTDHDLNDTTSSTLKKNPSQLYEESCQGILQLLRYLSKEKENCYFMAHNSTIVQGVLQMSRLYPQDALQMMAQWSRHPGNARVMVENSTLMLFLISHLSDSCQTFQNLSLSKDCRVSLAKEDSLLRGLTEIVLNQCEEDGCQSYESDVRLAAVSCLKHLCDEPANLIPLTNTRECVESLLIVSASTGSSTTDDDDDDPTLALMRFRACDALATLSHWLRKLATVQENHHYQPVSGGSWRSSSSGSMTSPTSYTQSLHVPSLRVLGWNQWQ